MACFNRLYSCSNHPIDPRAKIELREAETTCCAKITNWFKWIVQLPITLPHMAHTVFLMIKNQEMLRPTEKQLVPDRVVHRMASPTGNQHIVTSARLAREILRYYRNDNLFSIDEKGDNARLFLPVLQDIVEQPVDLEDFLFTCHASQAKIYRDAILDGFGPINLPTLKNRLKEVIKSAMDHLKAQEVDGVVHCSARELTGTFTVAVISNLLLGKNAANFSDYQPISKAISVCMEHAMMKFVWMKPTQEQERAYQDALEILRNTINQSKGPFLNTLKDAGMTDVQQKGVLFLMYIAGGETSSSLLEYMLWQLGQRPEYQKAILQEIEANRNEPDSTIQRFIRESLRLHTPAALIARTPRNDLEIRVTNPNGGSWTYQFPKGQNILISPYFAGRDSKQYHGPATFNPNREEAQTNAAFPWHPFGSDKHRCPGQWLALKEVEEFMKAILERYQIESKPDQAPRQKELLSLTLDPPVALTLKRRIPFMEEKSEWEEISHED